MVLNCRMCGSNLVPIPGSSTCECSYCKTLQTIPALDNEIKMNLYNRACDLRFNNEYDEAARVFANLTAEFPEEPENYWGLCLCKYGVEYVDDPVKGVKIPICHRTRLESIFDDDDYIQACENANPDARRVYRSEARAIDEIQNKIINIVHNEKPYDIYVSCQEHDSFDKQTKDCVMAQNIFNVLTEYGYRVFYPKITLASKSRNEYEPYVYAALNSAKILLVVGTALSCFNDVWVKNEWGRFLSFRRIDAPKTIVPCFSDVDPNLLPKEIRSMQGQDMDKIGFTYDLLKMVDEIIPSPKLRDEAAIKVLFKSGQSALEKEDWNEAQNCFDKVLNLNAEVPEAYVGLLLAKLNVESLGKLNYHSTALDDEYYFKRAVSFFDTDIAARLTSINKAIHDRLGFNKFDSAYIDAQNRMNNATSEEDYLWAADRFKSFDSYKDSEALAEECERRRSAFLYNKAENIMSHAQTPREHYDAYCIYGKIPQYKDSEKKRAVCFKNCGEVFYEQAKGFIADNDYIDAVKMLEIIPDYKDTAALMNQCQNALNSQINTPLYEQAKALENSDTIDDYEKAIELYSHMSGWKDSNARLARCRLRAAKLYLKDGKRPTEYAAEIRTIKRKKVGVVFVVFGALLLVAVVIFFILTVAVPFDIRNGELLKYRGFKTRVVIPEGVEIIGYGAFRGKDKIVEIVVPEGVMKIGYYAFDGCHSLKSCQLPDSLKRIDNEAFSCCYSLESITIPDGVTVIGYQAFFRCDNLKEVKLSATLEIIENAAFEDCSSLKAIDLPSTVTEIGSSAFRCCSSLETIVIPPKVKSVKDYCFDSCTSLKSVTLPNGLTSIGTFAFSLCQILPEIYIPDSVEAIPFNAFVHCDKITITYKGEKYNCEEIKNL